MKRFIEGADRNQSTLLPECLDDWMDESNPVRVVDAFVDALEHIERPCRHDWLEFDASRGLDREPAHEAMPHSLGVAR